jgi:hypothetical protein
MVESVKENTLLLLVSCRWICRTGVVDCYRVWFEPVMPKMFDDECIKTQYLS